MRKILTLGLSRGDWAISILLAAVLGLAISLLVSSTSPAPCVSAAASCPVGSSTVFSGTIGIQDGQASTITIDVAGSGPTANRTYSLPDVASDTFALIAATQTLTNKTLTSPTIGTSPTAAGATWADLGTVSTVDINGGTIDGTTIGGASAGAGTFGALVATGFSNASGDITFSPTGDAFFTDGTGVVHGHTAQITVGGVVAEFQQHGTAVPGYRHSISAWANNANAAYLIGTKSRSGTIGSFTIVQDNDAVLTIDGAVDDGTDLETSVALIHFRVDDGSPAADGIGGEIVMQTSTTGTTGADMNTAITISNAQLITLDHAMVVGSPTGGDKGTGTINAVAVYDDNVLLTDYVSDAYLGLLDDARLLHYDALVPNRQHKAVVKERKGPDGKLVRDAAGNPVYDTIPAYTEVRKNKAAKDFAARGVWVFNPLLYGQYFLDNGHLPQLLSEVEWSAGERLSTGAMAQQLNEIVEILALQNYDLAKRLDTLEERIAVLEGPGK